MLNLRRLHVLATVARCGSFAEAARELSYTPAAVSQQVATLERETRLRLVERLPRGVRLTDAGRVLVDHANAVLTRLAAAEAAASAFREGGNGHIRVAAFSSAWQRLLPRAVTRFRAAHESVALTLEEKDPEASLRALAAGETDVAVVFEPNTLPRRPEGVTFEHLLDDPLRAAFPPLHRLAGRARIRLDELADEDWVQPTAACAALVADACLKAGFAPRVVFASADYGAIQGFVTAGGGVALVPEMAATRGDDVRFSEIIDGPERTVWAATLTDRPPIASFIAALRAVV